MEPNRMRKIEVQSPEDIRFILENLTNAARAKINQHLPPSSADNNNDELRKRVEGMVIEYIQKTITLSLPSISVNGLDAPSTIHPFLLHPASASAPADAGEEEEEQYEGYDRKLHDRVSALYAELERETLRVAQLRREAPGRALRAFEEALRREGEGDERILKELGRKGGGGEATGELGVRELERGEEVRKGFEDGVGVLVGLQSKLPAIAHKLTRAQDALDYVESGRTTAS